MNHQNSNKAKPFLKWAGGKSQLIDAIAQNLPENFNELNTYVEPFVGSGAVLFWILNNYPNIKKAVINDINEDLINTYRILSDHPKELISFLKVFQVEYHFLENNREGQSEYYYLKRKSYNRRKNNNIKQAALFIFLNKTCFNGLYRVNRNNEFNVPMGSYKKPNICDEANLLAVSQTLQKVEILCGNYEKTLEYADSQTFFYFDPPYKPLNTTSNFNSYSKTDFNDKQQIRLQQFCSKLDKLGHPWMLSNSDVKDAENHNDFFDNLYSGFNIKRVKANRRINSVAEKRGKLNELLITNYK